MLLCLFHNLVRRTVLAGASLSDVPRAGAISLSVFCCMTAPPSFSQRPIQRFISHGQGCSLARRLSGTVTLRLLPLREKEGRSGNAIRFEERRLIIVLVSLVLLTAKLSDQSIHPPRLVLEVTDRFRLLVTRGIAFAFPLRFGGACRNLPLPFSSLVY